MRRKMCRKPAYVCKHLDHWEVPTHFDKTFLRIDHIERHVCCVDNWCRYPDWETHCRCMQLRDRNTGILKKKKWKTKNIIYWKALHFYTNPEESNLNGHIAFILL